MGDGQRIHHLAPETPYRIHMTLEATDDLEEALAVQSEQKRAGLERFIWNFRRSMVRISTMPHLGRIHHGQLRVTLCGKYPYRIWYVLDDTVNIAILLGIVAVTHPSPENGRPPGPWKKIWWKHMPYLPPRLPDPYPSDSWAADPSWQEEDDQWWVSRMPSTSDSDDTEKSPPA